MINRILSNGTRAARYGAMYSSHLNLMSIPLPPTTTFSIKSAEAFSNNRLTSLVVVYFFLSSCFRTVVFERIPNSTVNLESTFRKSSTRVRLCIHYLIIFVLFFYPKNHISAIYGTNCQFCHTILSHNAFKSLIFISFY